MRPLIAITSGEVYNQIETWSPVTYGQSYTYVEAITRAGGVPFIVPLTKDKEVQRRLYELADGILFAGGNDLDPELYHECPYPETVFVSKLRDEEEVQLMQWALEDKKPFIGICRGMHLLNVIKGGTLYQDIPTDLPSSLDHNSSTKRQSLEDIAHILKVDPHSRLGEVFESTSIGTNTHHHQAIKKLGEGLTETAWSDDGLIEAIELTDRNYFSLSVQSHPESLDEKAEIKWRKFFAALVEEARS